MTGEVAEPNEDYPAEIAAATLSGIRSGHVVDFTKTYHGAGDHYENPVDYTGAVSEYGLTITGIWALLELGGAFEMHRDTVLEPATTDADFVESPV